MTTRAVLFLDSTSSDEKSSTSMLTQAIIWTKIASWGIEGRVSNTARGLETRILAGLARPRHALGAVQCEAVCGLRLAKNIRTAASNDYLEGRIDDKQQKLHSNAAAPARRSTAADETCNLVDNGAPLATETGSGAPR